MFVQGYLKPARENVEVSFRLLFPVEEIETQSGDSFFKLSLECFVSYNCVHNYFSLSSFPCADACSHSSVSTSPVSTSRLITTSLWKLFWRIRTTGAFKEESGSPVGKQIIICKVSSNSPKKRIRFWSRLNFTEI